MIPACTTLLHWRQTQTSRTVASMTVSKTKEVAIAPLLPLQVSAYNIISLVFLRFFFRFQKRVFMFLTDMSTTCKAYPEYNPLGCTLCRLLVIVNWWGKWFAYVQRSTCTSCRIPVARECRGHAWGGYFQKGDVRFQGVNVRSPVYWCDQQNSSTVDLVYYTYKKWSFFFSCCTRFYRASSNRSVYAVALCPSVWLSVRLSQVDVPLKWLYVRSHWRYRTITHLV